MPPRTSHAAARPRVTATAVTTSQETPCGPGGGERRGESIAAARWFQADGAPALTSGSDDGSVSMPTGRVAAGSVGMDGTWSEAVRGAGASSPWASHSSRARAAAAGVS